MKKCLFLFTLILVIFTLFIGETAVAGVGKTAVSSNGVHYTIVPKGTIKNMPKPATDFYDNTEYLVITFAFSTPFGVPLLDGEGNPVLDEKNSPVIVLEERHCQFRKVLRITTAQNEVPQYAWGKAHPDGDQYDGKGGLLWDPVDTKTEFMSFIMAGGDVKGYFNIDLECPIDRGPGMGKMILHGSGYIKMKTENGKFVISSGWGNLIGRGVDDSGATGTGEKATIIEKPITGFGAWGTVTFTRYGGTFSNGNLRNILKEKTSIKPNK